MDKLSSSAKKVQKFLEDLGLKGRVVELPDSTRTAIQAAEAIGCGVEQIVKSLVFKTSDSNMPILVVASGMNHVNEKMIAALCGESIEKADAEFVKEQTGFSIGGVPPAGHIEKITTFIDEDLLKFDQVWAAAGTPHAVFPLTSDELVNLTDGKIVPIK